LFVFWLVNKHGVQICSAKDSSVFLTACCVTDHDRSRFVADIREAVLEVSTQFLNFCKQWEKNM